jgi:ABC-type anion transport system duplicated permease subunit
MPSVSVAVPPVKAIDALAGLSCTADTNCGALPVTEMVGGAGITVTNSRGLLPVTAMVAAAGDTAFVAVAVGVPPVTVIAAPAGVRVMI